MIGPGTTARSPRRPFLPEPGPRPGSHRATPRFRPLALLLCMVSLALGATDVSAASGPSMSDVEAPGPVSADPFVHTYLEASEPEDGEVVEEEVDHVLFRFNTSVQLPFSDVTVRDGAGDVVEHGDPVRDEGRGDEYFLVAFPAPLEPDTYTVEWQTAGPDDHVVRDTFSFSVTDPDEPEAPSPEPIEPAPTPDDAATEWGDPSDGPTGIFVRWLFLVGIVGMMGMVGFRALVLPRLASEEGLQRFGELALARGRTAAWVFGAMALIALPLRLWVQSAALFGADGALHLGNMATVVFRTSWGMGFLAYLAAIILFGVGLLMAGAGESRNRGWVLAGVAALLLPLATGLSGHAWGTEDGQLLAVGSLYVHVLAAGLWMGGLAALLVVGLPALRAVQKERRREGMPSDGDGGRELPGLGRLVASFSTVALVAVVLMVASGFTQAWILAGAPWEILGTEYGRTLLVKVGIAVGAFALGFYNWRVVRPALQRQPTPGILRIPATLEVILGLGVLLVTALLVTRALP